MAFNTKQIAANPIALGFILLSLVVIYIARGFPDSGEVGAGFFPIALSVAIIFFSIIVMVTEDQGGIDIDNTDLKRGAPVFALLVGYLVILPTAGFVLGTIAFLIPLFYYSGIRSKPVIVALSVGITIALHYIFVDIFLVRLPEGVLPVSRILPNLPLGVI